MNQARISAHGLHMPFYPLKIRRTSDWQYGLIVPGIAPFFGAVAAALFAKFYLGI